MCKKLGCPHLDIVEPVATKLEPDKKIDYIREVSSTQHTKISTTHTQSPNQKKRLMIVGGCNLEQACHYIDKSKFTLITHFNFMGDRNIGIFRDHPVYFRQVGQLTDEELSEMRRIPYWSANMLNDDILHGDYDVIVYSVLKVYDSLIYRNRKNGRLLVRPSSNILERTSPGDLTQEEWEYFKLTYECIGMTSGEQFYDDLNFILQTTGRPIIFINGAEVDADLYKGNASLSRYKDMNAVLDRFVSEHADRCSLIDMRKLVTSSADITDTVQHYGRLTYVSIAEQIMKMSGREVHYSRLRVFLHSHLHTLLWHFGYFKGIRRKLRRLFKHNDTAN